MPSVDVGDIFGWSLRSLPYYSGMPSGILMIEQTGRWLAQLRWGELAVRKTGSQEHHSMIDPFRWKQ
jgi:hypothetical protein